MRREQFQRFPDSARFLDLSQCFCIEDLLEMENGVVVLDLSSFDAFYTDATNSKQTEEIKKKILANEIIPINADVLGDLAENHAVLHSTIGTSSNIPVIPTVTNLHGKSVFIKNYIPESIPGLWVSKKSGPNKSHGGKGVEMIFQSEITQEQTPQNLADFLQPFILPPIRDGVRTVSDYRIMMVGGKPVGGIERRAREPLPAEVIEGKTLPQLNHFPSALAPGPKFTIDYEILAVLNAQALAISELLQKKMLGYSHRMHSSLSPFGYGSMDFLIDNKGMPLLVDFDIGPSVPNALEGAVSIALAEYLTELIQLETKNGPRNVSIIGDKHVDFVRRIKKALISKGVKEETINIKNFNISLLR